MDLALYLRVLRRFKFIVAIGFVVGVALAYVSFTRQSETWQAQSTLLITQRGFTFGRTVVPVDVPPAAPAGKTLTVVPKFADDGRLAGFAMLYARLANSDQVMQIMRRSGPIPGKFGATPVYTSDASNATTLPMLQVAGYATTPAVARSISARASNAFLTYLRDKQDAAAIPADQRILIQEANRPKALLLEGRKKTMPVLVFVAMMSIAIGLAFILENMRPRIREITPRAAEEMQPGIRASA